MRLTVWLGTSISLSACTIQYDMCMSIDYQKRHVCTHVMGYNKRIAAQCHFLNHVYVDSFHFLYIDSYQFFNHMYIDSYLFLNHVYIDSYQFLNHMYIVSYQFFQYIHVYIIHMYIYIIFVCLQVI